MHQSLSFVCVCTLILLNTPQSVWAQDACGSEIEGTTLGWTQPSQIDPADERSLRWPVDASLRFSNETCNLCSA